MPDQIKLHSGGDSRYIKKCYSHKKQCRGGPCVRPATAKVAVQMRNMISK